MRLKDIVMKENFCYFEMKDRKFMYTRSCELRELFENSSMRKTPAFILKNQNEEVKVIKTIMDMYKEDGF